jgi:hypothetical protein
MKNCKNHIHHLEEQCHKIAQLLEKLLIPQVPQEKFIRVLTRTAKDLDQSVTGLYTLSQELKSNNLAEASNWLYTVQHDFSKASKMLWKDCIQPLTNKVTSITSDTIERIKHMLKEILKIIKEDMKMLLSTDNNIHSQNTHIPLFAKLKAVHKKYEGKNKKDEKII